MKKRSMNWKDNYCSDNKKKLQRSDLRQNYRFNTKAAQKQWSHHQVIITTLLVTLIIVLLVGLMILYRAGSTGMVEKGVSADASWGSNLMKSQIGNSVMISASDDVWENKDSRLDQNALWDRSTVLSSVYYPIELEIPIEYEKEVVVDTPFSESKYGIYYSNAVFTFYDRSCKAYGMTGLVWCIVAFPLNEFDNFDKTDDGHIYSYNQVLLGTDENFAYELVYPNALEQYNSEDASNTQTYYKHSCVGQIIIERFIKRNKLESDGTWIEQYEKCTIDALEKNIDVSK